MSIYKGNNLISGAMPNSANQSLSNLDSAGQAIIDNKANTNLTNLVSTSSTNFDGQWVSKGQRLASGVTMTSSGYTYSLSSYLPADSYKYEVLIGGDCVTGATAGNAIELQVGTDIMGASYVCGARTRTASNVFATGNIVTSVGTDRTVIVRGNSGWVGKFNLYIYGYRRIGTNQ